MRLGFWGLRFRVLRVRVWGFRAFRALGVYSAGFRWV